MDILCQVIELIRQFYDGKRTFRITGESGEGRAWRYVSYSNEGLGERSVGIGLDGEPRYYRPVFDIDVCAEQHNPQDRIARNELMIRLYETGMLSIGQETAALRALSGLDFDGIGSLRQALSQESRT